jgi:dihydrodipicolinate synthase/N-acetylneuraminate lyase
VIRGAFAAAVTPLREGGARLDPGAVAPYAAFLAEGGVDGVFVLGTTGEGILLSPAERREVAERFAEARGRLALAVHCGAQSTAETAALAAHAATPWR